jgi:hypothetical protein
LKLLTGRVNAKFIHNIAILIEVIRIPSVHVLTQVLMTGQNTPFLVFKFHRGPSGATSSETREGEWEVTIVLPE